MVDDRGNKEGSISPLEKEEDAEDRADACTREDYMDLCDLLTSKVIELRSKIKSLKHELKKEKASHHDV